MIRSVRARSLVASIINDGYDPTKVFVDNLLVEAAVDENGQVDRKFTEHYLATAGKDEHNLFDPCAVAEYGALCNNTMNIGKALRPMPPTWGDSEVGVHKIEGRQKKVRRERGTQRHRESGTGGQSGGNRAGRQSWDNF